MEQIESKEILEKIQGTFKEMTKEFALDAETKAEIKELKEELKLELKALKENTEITERLAKLDEIAEKQGTILGQLKAAKIEEPEKLSFFDQVKTQITTHADKFKSFVEKSSPFSFELKTVGNMTYSNITGSTTLLPMPEMEAGYNPARRNPATFLDVVSVGSTNSARIAYVDQVSPDGTAATTSEGSAKPQIDADYKVSYSSAVKVAAYTKISDEMLDDVDFMATAVSEELLSRVRIALSGNIYTYVTSGMTPGYTEVHSNFLDYFVLAKQATIWDVLNAAKATIEIGNHVANTVMVSPTTFAIMNMSKDANGQYNIPKLVTPTLMVYNGMNIISSNQIAGDAYIVCDITKLNVKMYKSLVVEAGWDADDFTKNMRTFRGECRAHYYVKDNDKTAFLFGDLSASVLYMTAAA